MNVPLAQTGHEGYKISAPGQIVGQPGEKDVELKMIPNYQGFIPKEDVGKEMAVGGRSVVRWGGVLETGELWACCTDS